MYQIVYDFIYNNVFDQSALRNWAWEIGGFNTNLRVWLSHTATIVCMCLFIFALILLLRWIYRLFAGLLLLK